MKAVLFKLSLKLMLIVVRVFAWAFRRSMEISKEDFERMADSVDPEDIAKTIAEARAICYGKRKERT